MIYINLADFGKFLKMKEEEGQMDKCFNSKLACKNGKCFGHLDSCPSWKCDHEKLVQFGKNSTVNIDFKGIAWDIGKNP